MKTELRLAELSVLDGEQVIELWFGGVFIGQVVGSDGPGVRVLSKYPKSSVDIDPLITEITVDVIHR